ncbi:MAG: VPLPA-CTERM-specific exosortase XrtD, partial [Desulfobacteraceae bacterium]|nr:VPLPA-CTERM-specific exosortase XrtD [Desulfobacteraceae bacterium]
MEENKLYHQGHLLQLLIYIFLLTGIYFSTFTWLVKKDWARDDYSYGVLIPFIVLYLLWEKKNHFFSVPSAPTWKGFILLVPGLGLFWLGELAGEFFMLYFSFWLIIVSLCWINLGFQKLTIILFPLLFSLTMFPLPSFIHSKVTLQLKLISTKIGVWMMHVYGISAFREGNVIDLGSTQLQVVDACSGLRYLIPMIVLSILVAYFYHGRFWKKVLLVLSSIPLTIFSNSLRIALTGILSERFGMRSIEGFFHDFEGWLIFMITLAMLLLEIWILNRLFPEPKNKTVETETDAANIQPPRKAPGAGGLKHPGFILSVVLLGTTLAVARGVEFREAVPMNNSFQKFPMQVGKWSGSRQLMDLQFIEALDMTDYIMADFQDASKKAVNFYVAYYASQRKGESIHSPETCLMGDGWQFQQAGRSSMRLNSGE